MQNFTVKTLKAFTIILIVISSILTIIITPGNEDTKSIYSLNSVYNNVPYRDDVIDEIAMSDDFADKNVIETFTGTITAYGPDCVGCIGITSSGYKVAEKVNGVFNTLTITYDDKEYGTLRIFAAATSKFPHGTIVRASGPGIDGYIMGIVLDTGGAMRNAWARGDVLMDLLFKTEYDGECNLFGRKRNVTFEILRYGF